MCEKSVKAFLTWHDQPFRKTHDLEEVGLACIAIDPTLAGIAREAGVLTAFAWRLRYPGAPDIPDGEETQEMWNQAVRALAIPWRYAIPGSRWTMASRIWRASFGKCDPSLTRRARMAGDPSLTRWVSLD